MSPTDSAMEAKKRQLRAFICDEKRDHSNCYKSEGEASSNFLNQFINLKKLIQNWNK